MQQTATAPPPAGPARTWQATYPGTADQLRHVRAALRPLLRDCPAAQPGRHRPADQRPRTPRPSRSRTRHPGRPRLRIARQIATVA